jgi:hypothetical protein
MRIIKLGLLSFFFLFLLVTLISLLFPSQLRLSRATNLANEREQIFALLKNDTAWHPAYNDSASAATFKRMHKQMVEQTDSTYILSPATGGTPPRGEWLALVWCAGCRFAHPAVVHGF